MGLGIERSVCRAIATADRDNCESFVTPKDNTTRKQPWKLSFSRERYNSLGFVKKKRTQDRRMKNEALILKPLTAL